MDATAIPFSRLIGLRRNADGHLELPFEEGVHNHLGTVHASAQVALAETASGDVLARTFPDLADRVIPIVREVRAKFRRPGLRTLTAYPLTTVSDAERIRDQFEKKGRAMLTIEIEVRDAAGEVTCSAAFDWFIQRR
jgi:acyl-coenzyme A thioesterase PaaI-like protein